MSELDPYNSRIGYLYRSALGLRLLQVGVVVRNEGIDPYRVSFSYFVKTEPDRWMRCDQAGRPMEFDPNGPLHGPFRSEQIYLPAELVETGVRTEGEWTRESKKPRETR